MKMPEPVAEVRESRPVNANGDTVKAAFLFDTTLPSGTKLYDKQALIDLLEAAINSYSPDDTAMDYINKLIDMKETL